MLQKIITIGPEQWIKGLAPAQYLDGGKALWTAKGVEILRNASTGRLSGGYGFNIISSSTSVKDNIRWMVSDQNATDVYGYGDGGKFCKIATNDAVTFITSVSGSVGNGLVFYNDRLIYAKNTTIGYSPDPSAASPTFRDTAITLSSTITSIYEHPMKIGADRKVYCGNGFRLAQFTGAGDLNVSKLTFEDDWKITALENDGFYLIIGLTGVSSSQPRVAIAYWDMVSSQVNRWYDLPGGVAVNYLYQKDGWTYIFTKSKIYRSQFDVAPQEWFSRWSENTYASDIACTMEASQLVDEWLGGLYWGGTTEVNSYSSENSQIPSAFFQPWYFPTITQITSLFSKSAFHKFFVAGQTNKLYRVAGGYATGVTATSPFINLGRYWKVKFLKIYTDELESGDTLTLSLIAKASGTELLKSTTFSFAVDGARTSKKFALNPNIIDQFQLAITFTAGSVKVKRYELFGEPMEEIYAEV